MVDRSRQVLLFQTGVLENRASAYLDAIRRQDGFMTVSYEVVAEIIERLRAMALRLNLHLSDQSIDEKFLCELKEAVAFLSIDEVGSFQSGWILGQSIEAERVIATGYDFGLDENRGPLAMLEDQRTHDFLADARLHSQVLEPAKMLFLEVNRFRSANGDEVFPDFPDRVNDAVFQCSRLIARLAP